MKRAAFLGVAGVIGFASGLFLQVNYRADSGVEVSCGAAWAGSECKLDSEGECSGTCAKGYCAKTPSKACGCVHKKSALP